MFKVEKRFNALNLSKLINDHNIILYFNGRSEAGCRALGYRSIISNPNTPHGKDIINFEKGREWFRPIAASIMVEHFSTWFETDCIESPFMTDIFYAKEITLEKAPNIVHIDKTCRVQTVSKNHNPNFYNLLESFYNLTNMPMLVNTSFNLAGEPIVENPKDAINSFLDSNFNFLYFADIETLLYK